MQKNEFSAKLNSMKTVRILYGSCGGNTELVCEKVASLLEKNCLIEMRKATLAKPEDMQGADLLILASPTYGHGLLEKFMDVLVQQCKELNLQDQAATVIGLGDYKYDADYHIAAATLLEEFLTKKGATLVHPSLKISKEPLLSMQKVEEWATALSKTLA